MALRVGLVSLEPQITDAELDAAAAAVQYQLRHHVAELWNGIGAATVIEVVPARDAASYPGILATCQDSLPVDGALAYHEIGPNGRPSIFLSGKLAREYGTTIACDLSHEVIEAEIDPQCVALALGPHPQHPSRAALIALEACDPTQLDYELHGQRVADFVAPAYFDASLIGQPGTRTRWLQTGPHLQPFGCLPSGYLSFLDLGTMQWGQYMPAGAIPNRTAHRRRNGIRSRHHRRGKVVAAGLRIP